MISKKIQFMLDEVLNDVCRGLPQGGDHESRKYEAERLFQAAETGETTASGLRHAGREALAVLMMKPQQQSNL